MGDGRTRWEGRPWLSRTLRLLVFCVPILAAVGASMAVSRWLPRPDGAWQLAGWWLGLAALSLVVLLITDRLARRALPLAALLRLSMLFPDKAPSRFKIARDSASLRKLQNRLDQARAEGIEEEEPARAAETIITLVGALGAHDRKTRGHSERVHVFTELLAEELELDDDDRDRLRWAAILHDVGKLVISERVLNKAEQLTEDEWSGLRSHPEEGLRFIRPLASWLGEWAHAVEQHHERFDGSGYPAGMAGHNIARSARIVAVADAFEVMTAPRRYRQGTMSAVAARRELTNCAGTQFDPAIVRAFVNISIGRLRRAIGPVALLAPFPALVRLGSLGQTGASVSALAGGGALAVFGGLVGPLGPAQAGDGPTTAAATQQASPEPSDPAPAADPDSRIRRTPGPGAGSPAESDETSFPGSTGTAPPPEPGGATAAEDEPATQETAQGEIPPADVPRGEPPASPDPEAGSGADPNPPPDLAPGQ